MVKKVKSKVNPSINRKRWDEAITTAQLKLDALKHQVDGLERTVNNWTKLRDQGMEWPTALPDTAQQSATRN